MAKLKDVQDSMHGTNNSKSDIELVHNEMSAIAMQSAPKNKAEFAIFKLVFDIIFIIR